ncbi:MAG: hypothetical protein RDU20_23765, partial [Desulfomonilaceae bacterium]|nr:hypothetical protein [Desulfomonilaceae bacterium]
FFLEEVHACMFTYGRKNFKFSGTYCLWNTILQFKKRWYQISLEFNAPVLDTALLTHLHMLPAPVFPAPDLFARIYRVIRARILACECLWPHSINGISLPVAESNIFIEPAIPHTKSSRLSCTNIIKAGQ